MRRGEVEHQVHVVLDQQHRHIRRQRGHGLQQFLALARRHAGHRLVEQQHARLAGQRNRDLQQPALAVGQVLGPLVASRRSGGTAPATARNARPRPCLAPAPATSGRPLRGAATPPWPAFPAASCASNSWLIWKVRTMPRRTRWCGARLRDVLAFERDAAGGGLQHAGQQVDQRGLAGAVGADQRVARAARDVQADVVGGGDAAEALDQALGLQDDRRSCGTALARRTRSTAASAARGPPAPAPPGTGRSRRSSTAA